MTKRVKIVLTSLLLAIGFLLIQTVPNLNRFLGIFILCFFSLLFSWWSIRESISFNATLLTLILPIYFTLGVGLFWFLIPSNAIAKLPIIILYGFGIYSILLTANIFTVSAIRTIALVRAAKGVGFVITLFTSFLIFDATLSLRSHVWVTAPLNAFLVFPLFLQGLWSSILTSHITKQTLLYSVVFSLIIGFLSVSFYFWPVSIVVGSLFYTVCSYMLLGLGQAQIELRLFKQTIREYLYVGLLVLISILFATNFRG